LLEHVDLRTAAETVILTVAVVNAWSATAWRANWLDPARPQVRLLLLGLMFASLLMSVAIGDAFEGRAWLFVTGYAMLQVGRTVSSSWPCAVGRWRSTSSTTSSGSC
jgi:low temperature requirement protein LtrA